MESSNWVLKLKCQILLRVSILLFSFLCPSMSTTFPSSHVDLMVKHTKALHENFTALSDFRLINRRILNDCSILSPYLKLDIHSNSNLSDEEFVTVTVTGVFTPSYGDWVAMISPSNSNVETCLNNLFYYQQTGDTAAILPLLCHYPVKVCVSMHTIRIKIKYFSFILSFSF
ncbi:hypothetical protein MtrunA17_Chr1g0173501 [Medicago truncatula]|uniref:Purple acid phosphatase Fn3-like domain-containing protein n=1 Tax=Medicago truncatula TaxID=3880 RepID=A0A396JPH9_MEDTR|nr:hypothetical protein MtrunA17_Chr1g0173501 [Medicago truncatula]